MPKREDQLLLQDIAEAGNKIFSYTKGITYTDFIANPMMVDAVVRNFEVIGEAAKLVSEEMKFSHPEIEWKRMTQFRNVLIHDYFGIEHEIVWDVIQHYLPQNIEFIEQALNG